MPESHLYEVRLREAEIKNDFRTISSNTVQINFLRIGDKLGNDDTMFIREHGSLLQECLQLRSRVHHIHPGSAKYKGRAHQARKSYSLAELLCITEVGAILPFWLIYSFNIQHTREFKPIP